ncbi:MAG: hypothetical protein WBV06_01815 [Acidimicrobiia bacterium]|jgi:hypothetical protein
MTLLAVKPHIPQPDIGAVLDVLAHHRPIEFHCDASPVSTEPFEVDTRTELESRLEELFPFRATMAPAGDKTHVQVEVSLVFGPPISGVGDSLAHALDDLLSSSLAYVEEWERTLRFGAEHQRLWGWVYRLLLAGDDEHILATLLNDPIE